MVLLADRYELGPVLGRGGMAEVVRARDTRLDRDVAVKRFRGAAAGDRERFAGEMRLLAGLRHPSLLGLYDGGEEDGTPFLVLELADGPTLADRLRQGPLPPAEVEELVTTLAAGLEHLHERGIVHRDLKPSNVLSTADGRWLLGDFGIARLVDATGLTATGMTVGTPAYVAPEQLQGRTVGPAADVYSLGLVALEALTGTPAFPGPKDEAALARLAADPPVADVADGRWRSLLGRMTARDPAGRPSAAEVRAALAAEATQPLVSAPTEPLRAPPPVVRSSSPPWALVALVGVLALVLGGVLLTRALGDDGSDQDVAAVGPTATTTTVAPTTTPATTVAPTTLVPTTTVAPTTPAPASDCEDLQAQRAAIEEQKRALRDDHTLDHDARREQDQALKDQKRAVDEALRAAGC